MDFFQKKRIFQEKNPIFVWQFRKKQYLCIALDETWAVSAVGSEHLPYKQRVGGSNPSLPTRAVRTTVRAVCCFTCLLYHTSRPLFGSATSRLSRKKVWIDS